MSFEKGFSLIEVAMATGIFGLVMAATLFTLSSNFHSQNKNNVYEKAIRLMKENHFEVEAKSLDQLPATGACVYRDYDLTGKLISEGLGSNGSGGCDVASTADQNIRVVTSVYNLNFSNFTYTHSDFLKKPSDPDAIKEIRIIGRALDNKIDKRLFLTIFKR